MLQDANYPDLTAQDILGRAVKSKRIPGVYFLIKHDRIMYVGMSVNVIPRLANHFSIRGDRIDSASVIEVPEDLLEEAETHYIRKFLPPWNKCEVARKARKEKRSRRPPTKPNKPKRVKESERRDFWDRFYEANKESIHKKMVRDAYRLYKHQRQNPNLFEHTPMDLRRRCLNFMRGEHDIPGYSKREVPPAIPGEAP